MADLNAPEHAVDDGRRVPLLHLLLLVMYDRNVYHLIHNRRVPETVLLVTLLSVIAGSIISIGSASYIAQSTSEWDEWMDRDVKSLRISDAGEIIWEFDEPGAYRGYVSGWRVDMTDKPIDDAGDLGFGQGDRGLWVNPDAVHFWLLRAPGNGCAANQQSELHKIPLGGQFIDLLRKDGITDIKELGFRTLFDRYRTNIYIALCILNTISVLSAVVLFPMISASISALSFRLVKPDRYQAILSRLLVLNMYSAIPPMVIATVYAALRIPGTTFFLVFVIAFICYHMYLMSTFQHVLNDHEPQYPAS